LHIHLDLDRVIGVVAGGVAHQFLHRAENHHLHIGFKPAFRALDGQVAVHAGLFFIGIHIAPQGGNQPQIVQHHWAQVENEAAYTLEGGHG